MSSPVTPTGTFDFTITSYPRTLTVSHEKDPKNDKTRYAEVSFQVKNSSKRRVRVEALVNPLWGGRDDLAWVEYFTIADPVQVFEADSERTFTVRIKLVPELNPGEYRFQLVLVGVDDPDHQTLGSEEIVLNVRGEGVNPRPYIIGTVIGLVVVMLLAVALALLLSSRPIKVTLDPPQQAFEGEPSNYQVIVLNRSSTPVQNVNLEYVFPEGVMGATAWLPGAEVRDCDEDLDRIFCTLGTLSSGQSVTVTLQIIPGPQTEVITNTQTLTVTSQVKAGAEVEIFPAEVKNTTTMVTPAEGPVVVIDPSVGIAVEDETANYDILAWSREPLTDTQIVYQLPLGMQYISVPANCQQQENYSTLVCPRGTLAPDDERGITRVRIAATPIETSVGMDHKVTLYARPVLTATQALTTTQVISVTHQFNLPAVHTALLFNGVNEWAELGYNLVPGTFTAELWVNPYSLSDGQAFIGVHRQNPALVNLFLVGYYDGTMTVNVGGTSHRLDFIKRTGRFHLAVVVKKINPERSEVAVYVDRQPVPWVAEDGRGNCESQELPRGEFCMVFNKALDGGPALPWVLGQDWDPGGQGKKTTDFFQGAISEVSLWKTARTYAEISETYEVRPNGREADLIGYWRLEPVQDQRYAQQVTQGQDLIDMTGKYPGHRNLADWGEPDHRFGSALRFNGFNDYLVNNDLRLSNFTVRDGKVEVSLAGWVYMDGVPSRQQWIMGYVPQSSDASAPIPVGELPVVTEVTNAEQEDLLAAQNRLIEALNRQQALTPGAEQARQDLESARDSIYTHLYKIGTPLAEIYDPDIATLNTVIITSLNTIGGNLDRLNVLAEIQSPLQAALEEQSLYEQITPTNIDAEPVLPREAYMDLQVKLAYAQSLVDLWTVMARERITDTVVLPVALNETVALQQNEVLDKLRGKYSLDLPAANRVQFALAGVELAEMRLSRQVLATSDTGLNAQQFRASEILKQQRLAYERALQDAQAALASEIQQPVSTPTGSTAGSTGLVQDSNLSADEEALLAKLLALQDMEKMNKAEATLAQAEEIDIEVAEAQRGMDAASETREQNRQALSEAQAQEAQLAEAQKQVEQARQDVRQASTQQQQQEARLRLQTAQAELAKVDISQFESIQTRAAALKQREILLETLDTKLGIAVNDSVDAAFSAMQKNNVEIVIGPFLDWIFGTSTPRKSSWDAVYPVALLAAQQALKPPADAKVDAAQARYLAALEARDRLVNSKGNGQRRQEIIDQINAYLDSMNKEVNAAKAELDDALDEQRGQTPELKIQAVLAEALAREVAYSVTSRVVSRLRPTYRYSFYLFAPDPKIADQIKTELNSDTNRYLANVRRPVRLSLYYSISAAITRLDNEIAAGIDDATTRKTKIALRGQLFETYAALHRVLNAQNYLVQPQTSLSGLLGQVADESGKAASLDELMQALQDQLGKADQALQGYIQYLKLTNQAAGVLPSVEVIGGIPSAPGSTVPGSSTPGDTTPGSTTPGSTTPGSTTPGGTTESSTPGSSTTPGATTESTTPGSTTPGNVTDSGSPEGLPGAVVDGIAGGTPGGEISDTDSGNAQLSTGPEPAAVQVPPNIWSGLIMTEDGHIALVARSSGGATWSVFKDAKPVEVGQWLYFAGTFTYDAASGKVDDASLVLFRDGDVAKRAAPPYDQVDVQMGNLSCLSGFYIGGIGGLCNPDDVYFFDGVLDDVRLWDHTLDEPQVENWLIQGGQHFNEVAYWPFDDGINRTGLETCRTGETCDLADGARFPLSVLGPAWLPPEFVRYPIP